MFLRRGRCGLCGGFDGVDHDSLFAAVPTENLVWPITAPAGPTYVMRYTPSLHLVDFKCASSFGEAQFSVGTTDPA